jgi:hypothetical protein
MGANGRQMPRKQFFFEKKNQKTFVRFSKLQSYPARQTVEQKFLGSFFQKNTAAFLAASATPRAINTLSPCCWRKNTSS